MKIDDCYLFRLSLCLCFLFFAPPSIEWWMMMTVMECLYGYKTGLESINSTCSPLWPGVWQVLQQRWKPTGEHRQQDHSVTVISERADTKINIKPCSHCRPSLQWRQGCEWLLFFPILSSNLFLSSLKGVEDLSVKLKWLNQLGLQRKISISTCTLIK